MGQGPEREIIPSWDNDDVSKPITILVEGDSDQAAVTALAPRFGVDLVSEGITVTVIGGAGNFGRAIPEATALGHRVGGLYDEAEERFVAGALNRQEGEDLTGQGFFACPARPRARTGARRRCHRDDHPAGFAR